jgi:hypothetical protein
LGSGRRIALVSHANFCLNKPHLYARRRQARPPRRSSPTRRIDEGRDRRVRLRLDGLASPREGTKIAGRRTNCAEGGRLRRNIDTGTVKGKIRVMSETNWTANWARRPDHRRSGGLCNRRHAPRSQRATCLVPRVAMCGCAVPVAGRKGIAGSTRCHAAPVVNRRARITWHSKSKGFGAKNTLLAPHTFNQNRFRQLLWECYLSKGETQ